MLCKAKNFTKLFNEQNSQNTQVRTDIAQTQASCSRFCLAALEFGTESLGLRLEETSTRQEHAHLVLAGCSAGTVLSVLAPGPQELLQTPDLQCPQC